MPLITASDLAQTVARLRHRKDDILPESWCRSTSSLVVLRPARCFASPSTGHP